MAIAASVELTDEVVFNYWETKGSEMGESPAATIRDHHYRDVEIDRISRFLGQTDVVLDVGCGNGFSTLCYAALAAKTIGVDYSPRMIEAAAVRLSREPRSIRTATEFKVADARDLPFEDNAFTRVVMERCLINIPDRDQQVQATIEAGRVLKRGGILLLAEVTLQGHERVNHYRRMFGLDNLKVHWHNTYLDEPAFLKAIASTFRVKETVRFGMYGFLSKIVHPLLVSPNEPSFEAKINEVAASIAKKIPDFDGCSHQVLFVLEKK